MQTVSAYAAALQELGTEHKTVENRLRGELEQARAQHSESQRYQEELEAVVQRIALRMLPSSTAQQAAGVDVKPP